MTRSVRMRPALLLGAAVLVLLGWGVQRSSASQTIAFNRYALELDIKPVSDPPNSFQCDARVRDLETGGLVIAPRLLSPRGEEARVESNDSEKGLSFSLTVLVDASGKSASYEWDVLQSGKAVASHKATVRLSV